MGNDSLIASTTQFQTLLIALVLIVAVIYFFIELRRVDSRISSIETSIKNLINDKEIQMHNIRSQKSNIDVVPNVESNVERNDIEQDLEPNVEQDLEPNVEQDLEPNVEQDLEKGINDYLENQLNNEVIDEIHELSGHELSGHDLSGHDLSGHELSGHELSGHELSGHVNDEELEINTESIAVSGLSILSYMPMVSKTSDTNEPSNNIEEINESSTYVEESNDSNVEESNYYNTQELDMPEPIQEINVSNEETIEDMTIKELKNVLTGMELPTSGNKTKLIQRIVSNQK